MKRSIVCALVVAASLLAPNAFGTSTTDTTDLWYHVGKSGKGVQIVQTGKFLFVTVYIYGSDGNPFWITGELQLATDAFAFTGPVYVNTGPPFNGPFNPDNVTSRVAGTMSFTATSVTTGTLYYTLDGVVVTEALQRQPLTLDDYSGVYGSLRTYTRKGCHDPQLNGTNFVGEVVTIIHNGSAMKVKLEGEAVTCTIDGAYTQSGRVGQLFGPYSCTSGEAGYTYLYELSQAPNRFTARQKVTTSNIGCITEGELVALTPHETP